MSFTHLKKIVIPTVIGNVLEWYDFILYAYFMTTFAKLYFPEEDQFISLLVLYSTFASGFLMRPLGAILFGYIGDKIGRKTALYYSIIMMSLTSFLMSIIPTHQAWGIYASIFFVLVRLIQGLAVGGEYSGAATYLIESAPQNRKTFFGSFALASAYCGFVLSSLVGIILSHIFSSESLNSYGWRFGFVFGGLIGLIGFYVRSRFRDTKEFECEIIKKHVQNHPLKELYINNWRNLLIAVAVGMFPAGLCYMVFVYFSNFLELHGNFTFGYISNMNLVMMILVVVFIPVVAYLADRFFSRKFLMWAGLVLTAIFCLPLMHLLISFPMKILLVFGFLDILFEANLLAEIASYFPVNCRYSAIAITLNLTNGIAGGIAPLTALFLIHTTGILISPMFYIIGLCLISAVGLIFAKRIKVSNMYINK